jgi:exosome complex component RRP4
MRELVMPGDMVSEKPMRIGNGFIQNGKTYSKVLGIYEENSRDIIPLEGTWSPRVDDSVVGIIAEVKPKVYIVDLYYFGRALLIPGKYDKYEFECGDMISAVIKDIEGKNTIILIEPQKLDGGTIIEIKPKKIPRVIGKKSTMIRQIAEATSAHIIVGMNGLIWMKGGNTMLATEALLKIEREAHIQGLTESIRIFLEDKKQK